MDSENIKWYAFLSNTLVTSPFFRTFIFFLFKPEKLYTVINVGKRWFVRDLDLELGQQHSAFF